MGAATNAAHAAQGVAGSALGKVGSLDATRVATDNAEWLRTQTAAAAAQAAYLPILRRAGVSATAPTSELRDACCACFIKSALAPAARLRNQAIVLCRAGVCSFCAGRLVVADGRPCAAVA